MTLGYVGTTAILDVHRSSSPHPAHSLIYDTLVTRGPSGAYVGHLASGWRVDDDGLSVHIQLRSGITFHDGTPLTGEAVARNIDRLRAEASTSPLVPGPVTRFLDALRTAEITGPLSLRLTFSGPHPELFHVLTLPQLAPMSPASWDDGGTLITISGTGPYRLQKQGADGTIILDRNPSYRWPPGHYENTGPAHPSAVVLRPFPDEVRMLADFRSGLIDVSHMPEFAGAAIEDEAISYHTAARPVVHYLAFNLERSPWHLNSGRRAVAMAMDRRLLLTEVHVPAVPNASPLAPGVWGHMEHLAARPPHRHDPEAAATLLRWEEARTGTVEPTRLTLITFRGGDSPAVASSIKTQLAAVGLEVTILLMESGDLWAALGKGEYDLALLSCSWSEPSFLRRYFHSRGDLNRTGVADAEIDALLDLLAQTVDPEERLEVLADLQELLISRAYWIWLYSPLSVTGVRSNVVGFRLSPWGQYWLHDVHLRQGR